MNGAATQEERREFLLLMEGDESAGRAYISQSFHREGMEAVSSDENTNLIFFSVVQSDKSVETSAPAVHRLHFLKRAWFRYAAAILLLIIGFSVYFILNQTSHPETAVVQNVPPVSGENDILPGSNRAVLTLSNGQKMELDSNASETIKDGTLSIENNNGQLIYKEKGVVAMNTMTTPKGGQYQLTLADGTKVWLNAASSITYPTAFVSDTREVTITGEAYFEVKKNPSKPFIVKTPKEEITVLGTQFNVNAYPDEQAMKTSLLEGSVKIANKILKPGEAFSNGRVIKTNIEQDVAWKNGMFDFNNLTLEEAVRQIERWYDVKIYFDGPVTKERLYGGIHRSATLKGLLKGMEGEIGHFTLEGNIVHIKSL